MRKCLLAAAALLVAAPAFAQSASCAVEAAGFDSASRRAFDAADRLAVERRVLGHRGDFGAMQRIAALLRTESGMWQAVVMAANRLAFECPAFAPAPERLENFAAMRDDVNEAHRRVTSLMVREARAGRVQ